MSYGLFIVRVFGENWPHYNSTAQYMDGLVQDHMI